MVQSFGRGDETYHVRLMSILGFQRMNPPEQRINVMLLYDNVGQYLPGRSDDRGACIVCRGLEGENFEYPAVTFSVVSSPRSGASLTKCESTVTRGNSSATKTID